MDRHTFEALVARAIDDLPDAFRDRLDNVEVVVEMWPSDAVLAKAGVRQPAELLGFYEGVPQTRRTRHYGLVLPDKISIFQKPIEMRCRTPEQVWHMVNHVLRHELAHHFGLDDEHLRQLGAY